MTIVIIRITKSYVYFNYTKNLHFFQQNSLNFLTSSHFDDIFSLSLTIMITEKLNNDAYNELLGRTD